MAQIYCPQCGSQLKSQPVPKFCKYCGYKIKDLPKSTQTSSTSPNSLSNNSLHSKSLYDDPNLTSSYQVDDSLSEAPPLGEPLDEPDSYAQIEPESPVAPVSLEFPSIPADVIDILAGRLQIDEIKDKMSAIMEEISKIEQKLDIGLVDASDAKEEIIAKRNELNDLKERKNAIPSEELPYEAYQKELREKKDKLLKLKEMKQEGKISRESVYEKLYNEYNGEYTKVKDLFDEERRRFNQWVVQLNEDVKNYQDHAELATTRAQLGEITEDQAEKDKAQYEEEAHKRELARKVIQVLLKPSQDS